MLTSGRRRWPAGRRGSARPGPRASTTIALSSRRSSSRSSTAIRPRAMMITRPQTASTSGRMCVESRMVCRSPSSRIRRGTSRIWIGSRPDVGSSRIRIGGSCSMASASPTRWRNPRESWPMIRFSTSVQPAPGDHLADRRPPPRPRHVLEPGPEPQELPHPHLGVQRHVLGQVADLPPDLQRLVEHVVPGQDRVAAGRGQVRRQHPHRRRLAGPVGAEQPDDLAPADREADRRRP